MHLRMNNGLNYLEQTFFFPDLVKLNKIFETQECSIIYTEKKSYNQHRLNSIMIGNIEAEENNFSTKKEQFKNLLRESDKNIAFPWHDFNIICNFLIIKIYHFHGKISKKFVLIMINR